MGWTKTTCIFITCNCKNTVFVGTPCDSKTFKSNIYFVSIWNHVILNHNSFSIFSIIKSKSVFFILNICLNFPYTATTCKSTVKKHSLKAQCLIIIWFQSSLFDKDPRPNIACLFVWLTCLILSCVIVQIKYIVGVNIYKLTNFFLRQRNCKIRHKHDDQVNGTSWNIWNLKKWLFWMYCHFSL